MIFDIEIDLILFYVRSNTKQFEMLLSNLETVFLWNK